MRINRLIGFSLLGAAAAQVLRRHSQGQAVDPKDVTDLSQAAALAQETYCKSDPSIVGVKIGDAKVAWVYGDGNEIQRTVMYYSESLGVVLAYEGTDSMYPTSVMNDIDSEQVPADQRFSDGLSPGAKLHRGFQKAFLRSADTVEKKLAELLREHPGRLTVIGHSQGASLALIAGVWQRIRLRDTPTSVRTILFALPRTGNDEFAASVDKLYPSPGPNQAFRDLKYSLIHVTNGPDWVPHAPPISFGFRHPSGEIWINPANSTNWLYYPGQENEHGFLSVASPNFFSFDDHQGVYFHTQIGAHQGRCPATVGED